MTTASVVPVRGENYCDFMCVDTSRIFVLNVRGRSSADVTPFTIGAGINEDDVIEKFPGLVDEVRLYDIDLLPTEIAALANGL